MRHLSDRIKYFVRQNEILLVLTDRPALFAKTDIDMEHASATFRQKCRHAQTFTLTLVVGGSKCGPID